MAQELTILSTQYELQNCSDEVLDRDINFVSRDAVKEYIFHLRKENTALKEMLTNMGPAAPSCPGPPASSDTADETKARAMKSSRGQIKFTAHFSNQTEAPVNLIWKDYEGKEVLVRQFLEPKTVHGESTFFTHPFLARDSASGKLRRFNCHGKQDVVFEGLNFSVEHNGAVIVEIIE